MTRAALEKGHSAHGEAMAASPSVERSVRWLLEVPSKRGMSESGRGCGEGKGVPRSGEGLG